MNEYDTWYGAMHCKTSFTVLSTPEQRVRMKFALPELDNSASIRVNTDVDCVRGMRDFNAGGGWGRTGIYNVVAPNASLIHGFFHTFVYACTTL